jgi:hypothetical protein
VDPFFVIGMAEKGPTAPVLIRSMDEFVATFGSRVSYGNLYDIVDAYLREGGTRAYVSRVVGPSATKASLTLNDSAGTPAPTVNAVAKNAGAWGANLKVAVTGTTGNIRIVVTDGTTGDLLETSPVFTERDDLLAYTGSDYLDFVATGSSVLLPDILTATSLTGGDDDRAAVVDATYVAAMSMFGLALGSGQIAVPGVMTTTVQSGLLAHAAAFNRVALLDAPDSATAATILAAANAIRSDDNARYGAMFGPKVNIPGITSGTTREMWASVIVAGLMARQTNPAVAAAGVNGVSRLALSVKYEYTDAERESLNAGSVDIMRPLYGAIRNYGFRSLVDPQTFPEWVQFTAARVIMGIKQDAGEIAERHVFMTIDGKGIEFSTFGGELSSMLSGYFQNNSLYGDSPQEAYLVDVGSTVNTPETIMDGQINANLLVRVSPFGEMVSVQIAKVPLPSSNGPASLAPTA